jgi:hypothetical protein
MKIVFSRHAKRRMKLYKISESWLESLLIEKQFGSGKHILLEQSPDHSLPIKIVIQAKEDEIVIITSYPLKKGK